MRILNWSELFWPYIGGAEVLNAHMVLALRDRGHDVAVFTSMGTADLPELPAEESYKGIPVFRFAFESALYSRDITQVTAVRNEVARRKREFAPDVVHLTLSGASAFFHMQTKAASSAPDVVSVATEVVQRSNRNTVIRNAIRAGAWVTSCSRSTQQDVLALAPEVRGRASAIHNGLATPPVEPSPLSFDPPRIVCAGRLVAVKGFDLALRAFPSVLATFPDATLVVAGDGVERPSLERLAAELGISSAVEFTGWVNPSDIYALMNTASVVVMPSRWQEPFGLVALQGSLMGRPVVASRVGGLPEVVLDGETGLLVENESPDNIAAAVTSLLRNPSWAARLGKAGRERAQREFSLDAYVNAYESLYVQLVEEKHAHAR